MRRRLAPLLVVLLLVPAALRAQVRTDTLRAGGAPRPPGDTTRDTTVGRGRGLPRQPSRSFPPSDSVIEALLRRPGYRVLRYAADSVQLLAPEQEVRLAGKGLVRREGSTLQADTITYQERRCDLYAAGGPELFDSTGVLVGHGMRYDACNQTGLVERARTDLSYGVGTWYLHGDMAFDNREDRVYAASATMTTCELPDPHYHFATREVKWVNKRLMVARPAVLYVADVPVAWLPFIFQDTRHGRRSGMLTPGFGINDIVRFNPGYQRHISNVGYYWALSDYTDAQVSLDWYSNTYTAINARFRYRWLDRFLAGGLAYSELHQADGSTSRRISWSHQQQFSLNTQLTANLDYASSSQIISRNAVDPVLAIGTIDSRLNYSTRTDWGTINLGGSRTQSLDKPQVATTFPSLSFSPNPIALGRNVVWSPSFSFTNSLLQQGGAAVGIPIGGGRFDSLRADSRTSSLSLSTPLRVGNWNLPLSIQVNDQWANTRTVTTDTVAKTVRTSGEQFQTGFDWSTGIALPIAFQGTWNLAPSLSMTNIGGGPYAVRNNFTNGQWITQGKRFQFGLGAAPTLFALLPGFGPVLRIRHALSPIVSWAYAPAADLPAAYARAVNQGNLPATLRQPARQSISLGLSQVFEAKLRPSSAPADTTRAGRADSTRAAADSTRAAAGATAAGAAGGPEAGVRKIKLLSVQSDAISYDFEQAKQPGRTGWSTQTWGNTLTSDLLHGLSLRITHDLWNGPVGYRGVPFAPSLTSLTFGVSLGPSVLNLVRGLFGLSSVTTGPERRDTVSGAPSPTNPGGNLANAFQRGPLATQFTSVDRLNAGRGTPFQASLNFSFQRTRAYAYGLLPNGTVGRVDTGTTAAAAATANSMVSGQLSFSPTAHWTVSWATSYNFTTGQFSDHVVRLDRDLHDWRATFSFVKSPNGNFQFNFNITLIPEPDLKVDYDQRTIR